MSFLVLQSSWWGREGWLLCWICLPGVSWWLGGSSSRCHGLSAVCDCGISWSYSFTIFGEISLLHSFSTLAFRPSRPGALWMFCPSNSLTTPFWSTVMSPMEENGLAPFEGVSESPLRVKADRNRLLQMSAFSFGSVLRILFSLSDVIPNASFLWHLINDQNFLIFSGLGWVSGSELSFSNVNILETYFQ